MSLLRNVAVFKNWPIFYAARYGLIRHEIELVHRNGVRLRLRPGTDDLKVVKSNWVKKHYFKGFHKPVVLKKTDVVVDVGSHIGAFSVYVARMAGCVISFEPERSNFAMLEKNIGLNRLNNVRPYNMAVSGKSGFVRFRIYEDGSTGSHSMAFSGGVNCRTKESYVESISLADVIKRHNLSRIDFLKMDCEGAEYLIIREMDSETASKIGMVAMEMHAAPYGDSIDLEGALLSLGFAVNVDVSGYIYAWRDS